MGRPALLFGGRGRGAAKPAPRGGRAGLLAALRMGTVVATATGCGHVGVAPPLGPHDPLVSTAGFRVAVGQSLRLRVPAAGFRAVVCLARQRSHDPLGMRSPTHSLQSTHPSAFGRLFVTTNDAFNDTIQATAAGYLEGALTANRTFEVRASLHAAAHSPTPRPPPPLPRGEALIMHKCNGQLRAHAPCLAFSRSP
jgi:hypothetical protein